MSEIYLICAGGALSLTLVALVLGLATMVLSSNIRQKYGNKLMQARITMQSFTVLFLLLAFIAAGS